MKKGRKKREVHTHFIPLERAEINDWSYFTSDNKKKFQFPKCFV
jgi:hypothetical protein